MSDIIRLLPESIASQIAAGEVVESPASAVKELLENAVDAGATSIQLEVLDGGKSLIHVLDNGCGMSPADARMAFEKHATSKIREAEDLYKLHTMGFRGEALAAISAISKIELRTRRVDQELGTHIQLSGSQVQSIEVCVMDVGTSLKVQDLFFNIPVRRRFLKDHKREFDKVLREFVHVALVNPHIAMTLHHDGALIKDLPVASLKGRVLGVVGQAFEKKLLTINYSSPMLSITGFVSQPQSIVKSGLKQYLFVNGRYMKHGYFAKAIELAYQDVASEGLRPSFFVYLTVPTDTIDVNISPTKTEVRFSEEKLIFDILKSLVREALSASASIPVIDFDPDKALDIPAYPGRQETLVMPELPSVVSPTAGPRGEATGGGGYARRVFMSGAGQKSSSPAASRYRASSMDINWDSLSEKFEAPPADEESSSLFAPRLTEAGGTLLPHGVFCGAEYPSVGQLIYKGRYIVTSLRRNLTIIDYRRAHERILFERYMLELGEGKVEVQQMMFPEPLELALDEAQALERLWADLTSLGFELERIDEQTYTLLQAPSAILEQATDLLRRLVAHCIETDEYNHDYLVRAMAMAMASGTARPYGQELSSEDVEALLAQLFATSDPNLTPNGKVIMTTFSEDFIDQRFG